LEINFLKKIPMSSYKTFRENDQSLSLLDLNLEGKNVLVRVDFNCPLESGKVSNNYRITESLKTLSLLKEKGVNKIVLISHLGRPKGEFKPEFSLEPIRAELEKVWGEKVVCPTFELDFRMYAKKVMEETNKVVLWENIRFWNEEKKNDPEFAKVLASGNQLFINEAFSACHRAHASVVGVAEILPSFAGIRLGEETREIYKLLSKDALPSVALVGGAKIETKVPVLNSLEKHYDKILLGGKIALEYEVFQQTIIKREAWMDKIELPSGYLGEEKFDIDEASALHFAQVVKESRKILWNGPVGKFEEAEFAKGSEIIAKAISENKEALRLVGGGDTIALLDNLGLRDQVGFVSTGGGAMLDYIALGSLPGLEGIEY